MLFYITSRIISSITAFLYPGYASYKTLSQRPASEDELERWLMYWSVLGCIVGVEYVAEWIVSWVPFYYTIKTVFLLYLALPQTRGSSYLYINHLQPFFNTHESQIDAALASFKAKVYAFLQERMRILWEHVSAAVGQQQQEAQFNAPAGHTGAAPTLGDPASGPAQLMSSLWNSYGPSIIATGTALMRQSAAAASGTARPSSMTSAPGSHPPSLYRADTSQSVLERKRQLETELAGLGKDGEFSTSRQSSASDLQLRERTTSGSGRFEEIEVPSDAEGYDVGDVGEGKDESGSGYESGRAGAQKRGSWFGWGVGGSGAKGGYERVKSD